MMKLIRKFAQNTDGATAVEYAGIISIVGIALIPALQTFEGAVSGILTTASTAF